MIYYDLSLTHEKVKVIRWSISTFWYMGLATNNEKWWVRKKGLYYDKNNSSDGKAVFHQRVKQMSNNDEFDICIMWSGAQNRFKSNPLTQFLINKQAKRRGNEIRIWFEISRVFFYVLCVWPFALQLCGRGHGARAPLSLSACLTLCGDQRWEGYTFVNRACATSNAK